MPSETIKANIQWGPGPKLIVRARVNPAAWAIHTEEGIFVAEIREREGAKHYADLFARSPELYEALERLVCIVDPDQPTEWTGLMVPALEQARAPYLPNAEENPPMPNETKWRVGSRVPLNVYEGDRPVCQCHNELDARQIIAALNWAKEESATRAAAQLAERCKFVERWTFEQRDDFEQIRGMFQKFVEQASQLQARVKFLEDEETNLIGRLARALGHDGTEAVGVDQMIQEVERLKRDAR